jgi:hypothetical protein
MSMGGKMKRSKAIALIMETFEMQGLGTPMREKDADFLLDALEKVGMLPPEMVGVYDTVPTVTPTGNHDYGWKRGWEPENE